MSTTLTTLSDLASRAGLNPKRTLVVRHSPREPALRKVLPWLVAEHPDLFMAYQEAQGPRLEAAMLRADHFLAFIGLEAGFATFAGAYSIGDSRHVDFETFWAAPVNQRLRAMGHSDVATDRDYEAVFDLTPIEFLSDTVGRLTVDWPGREVGWWRWLDRNVFAVTALNDESRFLPSHVAWTDLMLEWGQLLTLPRSLKDRLSQWRGIYFIFDVQKRQGYVGSASGAENILGRWLSYAKTGHGGNRQLKDSRPADLRFSVLELTAQSLPADQVIALENSWKRRLHTREFGLNSN